MTFARIRLILALAAFLGWLAYLSTAVWQKGTVQIVSRAQLTAATALVVAEVAVAEDGTPAPRVKVLRVLSGEAGSEVEVANLPASATPIAGENGSRTPAAGAYLLPLVKAEGGYRVAGLPRSPGGYEAVTPARPLIYPWRADVQAQLRTLGLFGE